MLVNVNFPAPTSAYLASYCVISASSWRSISINYPIWIVVSAE